MKLSEEALKQIKGNDRFILALAEATNRKSRTIERWLNDNDENLLLEPILHIIRKRTGMTNKQILDNE